MLSEVVLDTALMTITPFIRQRGSGHLAVPGRTWTPSQDHPILEARTNLSCKPRRNGAHVSRHLSFVRFGKADRGRAKVRTGFGKTDRPGS